MERFYLAILTLRNSADAAPPFVGGCVKRDDCCRVRGIVNCDATTITVQYFECDGLSRHKEGVTD